MLAIALGVFVLPAVPVSTTNVAAYDVCIPADNNACIHEQMATQARDLLFADNAEINQFWDNIKSGITHEDEFDHVYSKSWVGGSLVTITHFWDADAGPNDPVKNLLGSFPNAWQKTQSLWSLALGAYGNGDKAGA